MPDVDELRESWFKSDVDHLTVSIDHTNSVEHSSLTETFGGYVKHVKWGVHIPLLMGADHARQSMVDQGVEVFLDIRLSYQRRQMASAIINLHNQFNFSRVSVSVAGVREKSLEAGAIAAAQTGTIMVASISSDDEAGVAKQISKIDQVNGELDPEHQIKWAMMEARDVAQVRDAFPGMILSAMGIYLPDTTPEDIADRRIPEEAKLAGADEVIIGNAITFPVGMSSIRGCQLAIAPWAPAEVE